MDETLQNVIFEPLNLGRCHGNMERSIIKFGNANCDSLINKKAPIALDSHSSRQNQLQSHYFCDVMETRHNWPGLAWVAKWLRLWTTSRDPRSKFHFSQNVESTTWFLLQMALITRSKWVKMDTIEHSGCLKNCLSHCQIEQCTMSKPVKFTGECKAFTNF